MTIPTYTTLGITHSVITDSWSEPQPYLEPIATDMDGGNKRLRTRPGDKVAIRQFDILFTNAEFATFQTYVKTTLGNGCARFVMPVWNGASYDTLTVQFEKPYQAQPMPPKYVQVTFNLRIFPA